MKKDLVASLKQLLSIIDEDKEMPVLINNLKKRDGLALKTFNAIYRELKGGRANDVNEVINLNSVKNKQAIKLIRDELVNILTYINDDLNYDLFDYRSKNIFLLKRKMIELEILTFRGMRDFSMQEMNDILDHFLRLEDYEDALVALEKKRIYYRIYKDRREVVKLDEKVNQARIKKNALDKAINIYLNCGKQLNTIKSQIELNLFFSKAIFDLEYLYKSTKSKLILYYLLFIKYANAECQNDIADTEKYLSFIESLLFKSKVVFSNNRFHQLLLNKAFLKIKKGEYNSAIKLIHRSFLYTKSIYNNMLGRHLLSHIWLAQGKTENLLKEIVAIDKVISDNLLPNDFMSKHLLLKATNYFLNNNYNECLGQLSIIETNFNLDGEIKIKLRLLKIITLIELERNDEAEYTIENFRKLIERSEEHRSCTPRFVLIKKLLVAFSNLGFNSGGKSKKIMGLINQLERDANCKWYLFSSEPIPIHYWLHSRLNGESLSTLNLK